jgi:hypothetical protein
MAFRNKSPSVEVATADRVPPEVRPRVTALTACAAFRGPLGESEQSAGTLGRSKRSATRVGVLSRILQLGLQTMLNDPFGPLLDRRSTP